jgi:phospholipase C
VVQRLVELMDRSPLKRSYGVIIAYDEFGGFFDHAAPPTGRRADFFGPGTRIPVILVSPYAKHGTVDHTAYDTTSILKLITARFGLEPLPGRRFAIAGDMTDAFDFTQR